MMKFENKVVWITGASSGIGEALAYAFSRAGARLVLSARRREELERVRQSCSGDLSQILVLPLDLAELESLPAKVEEAISTCGRVDILVNNGGVGQRGEIARTSLGVDQRIMQVNYFGQIALTKAVLPHMIRQQSGHVVVISSVTGYVAMPRRSAYSASKHALHGFFNVLRAEVWRDHIKVTLICPGYVHTHITQFALGADGRPIGKPKEVAGPGISAEKAADGILKAVAQGKREAYPGGPEVYVIYLQRLFPGLVDMAVRRLRIS